MRAWQGACRAGADRPGRFIRGRKGRGKVSARDQKPSHWAILHRSTAAGWELTEAQWKDTRRLLRLALGRRFMNRAEHLAHAYRAVVGSYPTRHPTLFRFLPAVYLRKRPAEKRYFTIPSGQFASQKQK